MDSKYQEFLKFLKDSLESNTLQQSKLFTRKKIYLDNALSVNHQSTSNSFTSSFRGFWVVDSSDKDFQVDMFPNVDNNYGDKLPLKHNMTFDFGELVNGCKFEFVAQGGKWIEVLFFHKGFAQIGTQELDGLEIKLGSRYEANVYDVESNSISVNEINDGDKEILIENIGTMPVFLGDVLTIDDSDYKNLCHFLPPKKHLVFNGQKQVSVKTFAGKAKIRVVRNF